MAAYRADIEIGVKGLRELQNVTKRIEILSTSVDAVNNRLKGAVQSLNNYDANLAKAAATLQKVNSGTIEERDAIRQYVQALGQANTARDRQNKLIQEQIALQRKAVATADAGFGVQGPRQAASPGGAPRSGRPGRFSNVVLGAGFPLLFGGGPGAVLGGAAGGLVGGPAAFAAQIGLSALGQQLDMFTAATAKAAKAFTSTSAAFEMMEEKSLFSSEKVQELAIQLEEQGRVSELSTLLTKELTDAIGNEGVRAMQELGQTTNRTTELWNKLTLQLQALIAGPLNGFLSWINDALSTLSARLRFSALQQDLGGNAELQAEVQRRRKARGRGARLGALTGQDYQELIQQFGGLVTPTNQIPVTAADIRTITPSKTAAGPKPPADRTAQLAADLKAMQLMSVTQDGIRDALFEGNKQLAVRLEYDQKVYDINRDTEKALLRANYESEKIVIRAQEIVRLKDAELERLDKLRELEREITEEYYSRAGLSTRNLLQREGAGAFDLSLDLDPNNKATQKMDEIKQRLEELTDPINMAAQGAMGIGDAFSTAFQGIITGTQSTQEALSNFFKGVGDAFISMATEIIAQMVVMFAFKQLLGLFGGGGGGGLFSGAGPVAMPGGAGFAEGFSMPSLLPGRANGGPVSSNTPYVVGERGPELFVPNAGGSIVNNNDLRSAMGTSNGSAAGPVLNMSFETTSIGGTEYVSREQLEAAMVATRRNAARDGARQGMSMTLDKLQQSPGTRGRVGLR